MSVENKRRILIVDDSRTMRRMVVTSLSNIGECKFEEAANGLEAIERLVLGPADLMILDLNMPELHGIEVLSLCGATDDQSMPVVVLTTKVRSPFNVKMAAGASLYLTKPFSSVGSRPKFADY